jgi:hypothetical protein
MSHDEEGLDEALEDERRERMYAEREFAGKSSAPMPKDGKIARYWSFYDQDDDTVCDKVWVDRKTGERVMRYDAADPANTHPYYGASPDSVYFSKYGRDIKEMIDPSEVCMPDHELRRKWAEY